MVARKVAIKVTGHLRTSRSRPRAPEAEAPVLPRVASSQVRLTSSAAA